MYRRISPELVKKAKKSEQEFDKLMKLADRIIYHVAQSSGIRTMSVDDIVQEGRITAWKCVGKFKESENVLFSTYLIRSLKNRFGKKRGAEHTDKRVLNLKSESLNRLMEEDAKVSDYLIDEGFERFRTLYDVKIFIGELLDILPPEGYMLCKLMLRDLSISEIAKKMRTTQQKVRVLFKNNVQKHIMEAKKYGIV